MNILKFYQKCSSRLFSQDTLVFDTHLQYVYDNLIFCSTTTSCRLPQIPLEEWVFISATVCSDSFRHSIRHKGFGHRHELGQAATFVTIQTSVLCGCKFFEKYKNLYTKFHDNFRMKTNSHVKQHLSPGINTIKR